MCVCERERRERDTKGTEKGNKKSIRHRDERETAWRKLGVLDFYAEYVRLKTTTVATFSTFSSLPSSEV